MAGANAEYLRVGELAARTGASSRMIRHYEGQGLIAAQRSTAGHRLFEPSTMEQVRHIRLLLGAGLPTRAIRELLTCIRGHDRLAPCAVPVLIEHLRDYDARIAELSSTRDTLQGMIDTATPAS